MATMHQSTRKYAVQKLYSSKANQQRCTCLFANSYPVGFSFILFSSKFPYDIDKDGIYHCETKRDAQV